MVIYLEYETTSIVNKLARTTRMNLTHVMMSETGLKKNILYHFIYMKFKSKEK